MNLQHSEPQRVGAASSVGGRFQIPSWFWRALAFAFMGTLFVSSYFIYVVVRDYFANQQIVKLSDSPFAVAPIPEPDATPLPDLPRWSANERVNVLLMGIDQREGEEGPWRTDTMLVLTLDPVTMSAGMLSIPRDLWVTIPGYDLKDRINRAHYYGEMYDYPGSGPALARDTVTWNLGIPIHFFVRVNFVAFEILVDEVGGIDIYVPETIDDPHYPDEKYGYDPFYIEAGWQHLDGKTALKYARTRVTFGGDFDRGQRQQAVIMALRERVVKLDQLPGLVAKAPALIDTLGDAVRTDMDVDQALQLARLAADVDSEQIVSAVVDHRYTWARETPDGAQVLVPNREAIRDLRDLLFSGAEINRDTTDLATALAQENARVAVLNGSATAGLAHRAGDYLTQQGFQVVQVGDAATLYEATSIIDYADKPYTSKQLAAAFDLPAYSVIHGISPEGNYDVMVILGQDFELAEE